MKLSPIRSVQALYRLAMLVRDPNRLDEVFEMSDAVATPEAMQPMIDHVSTDPVAARAFVDRRRIGVDIPALRKLPEGTLGRTFAEHMVANNLDPSALPSLPSGTAAEYFRAHLYETHDIWHVVTGYATDLVGELGLQAFYLAQIPGPLPSLLIAVGFLRSAIYDQSLTVPFTEAVVRGWNAGRAARPLFGVAWDELWSTPIGEVRRQLGVEPAAPAAAPSVRPSMAA